MVREAIRSAGKACTEVGTEKKKRRKLQNNYAASCFLRISGGYFALNQLNSR